MSLDPKSQVYPADCRARFIVKGAIAASIIVFLATSWFVVAAWKSHDPMPVYICTAVWAVTPPVWFWFEYFYLYRRYGNPDTLELFKYGQQVAAAIWAGIAISLAAFVSSEHFKHSEEGKNISAEYSSITVCNPTKTHYTVPSAEPGH